jgi:hypothetical protein
VRTPPETQTPTHSCALCSAILATRFPRFAASCPPDEARFTRDQYICDACLAHDFTGVMRYHQLLFRTDLYLGMMFAFLAGAFYIAHHRVRGWPALFILFGTTVIAGPCFAFPVQYLRRATIAAGDRKYARRNPEEARREGERFYYLARWGTLTKHPAFARQMLRQSRQMNFIPPAVRFSDMK